VHRGSPPFLALYRAAHNNAVDLIQEAEVLFEHGRYCRAYALAFTALEEISKSQLAAGVHTGLIDRNTFQKVYRDHRQKIGRMAWATEDAKRYLGGPDGEYPGAAAPTFPSRNDSMNDSMYVNLRNDKVISSSDVIGHDGAESIIHTVMPSRCSINLSGSILRSNPTSFRKMRLKNPERGTPANLEATEFWGHQIGTKGFMK
jgi:AbiV family abortive infection protein